MRKLTVRAAVTFCAAVSLATVMGTADAAPVTSPRSAHTLAQESTQPSVPTQPVIVDCLWHPQVEPGNFVLACGDGNSRLTSLQWSRWDANSAVASGVNVVNDCKPYCAAGTFRKYPVTVRLDRPQTWKKNPQSSQYTRLSLVYTDSKPAGYGQTVAYPLWN
ncbi:hypothetical protein ACIOTI_37540 [Streptomyces sp. NPDC087843]|uniref:hypothetical protein n=1 Tax=Streptomyces sp. NPDC087843 TaxID=3365804 RepID=UPI0037F9F92B